MVEKAAPHPFTAGLKVALVYRPLFGGEVSYRPAVVAKVYANGNFLLEGSTKRYRASTRIDGTWFANETGGSNVYRVELITPELDAEVARCERRGAFREMLREIESARFLSDPSDELLALMRAVVDALAPKIEES